MTITIYYYDVSRWVCRNLPWHRVSVRVCVCVSYAAVEIAFQDGSTDGTPGLSDLSAGQQLRIVARCARSGLGPGTKYLDRSIECWILICTHAWPCARVCGCICIWLMTPATFAWACILDVVQQSTASVPVIPNQNCALVSIVFLIGVYLCCICHPRDSPIFGTS